MTSTKIIAVIILLSNITYSQPWRPATITRAAGDSLRGEVQFIDPDISPDKFAYRSNHESVTVFLTVDSVSSLRLEDSHQIFEPLEALIEVLFSSPIPPGKSPVADKKVLKAFGEVLIAGRDTKLYLVYDHDRQERFFIRKAERLTELIYRQYQVHKDGSTYNAVESLYKNQLNEIFSDCPALLKRSVDYDEKSLTRFVGSYISCNGGTATFEQKQGQPSFSLGVCGGYLVAINGATNGTENATAGQVSLSGQMLSRKFSGNRFVWLDIGAILAAEGRGHFYIGALAGTYIGKGRVQPLVAAGFSNLGGLLQLVAGVGIDKMVALSFVASGGNDGPIYGGRISVFPWQKEN